MSAAIIAAESAPLGAKAHLPMDERSEFEGGVENRPIDDRGRGVPEWSIGSPSSKGPSMLGLFGGVTSPIFTNDFRLCPADARQNTPLQPVK